MKRRVTNIVVFLAALSLCGVEIAGAFSGTTGNLKGKITDLTTGEGLPQVNVLVVGSGRGAVTNENGEYSLTGITPGVYAIRASLLSYQPIEAKKVVINADETTVFNFKLASTTIEQEGITVEGQRPLVDVKKMAGDQTYNKDKIEQLPNVKGVEDVLGLQAGVIKFGNQLFLRGGRANETQILIDGVVVNDVSGVSGTAGTSTANEQLQQLYSGSATGGGALSVAANAIQSVSVSSSGLDAEYGNAQSGIVNITTKSGSETYGGTLQYRTDGIVGNSFNENYFAANLGGPEPITSYLLPSLGVTVPGKLAFFLSSNFNQLDGAHLYSTAQFYHPIKRKIKFGGFFGRVLNGLGFEYSDKQNNTFSFNGKLSYGVGDNDQFAFSYRANASSSHPLSGSYSWKDRYDSTAASTGLSTQNVLQWTHILGTNSILKAYISRLESDDITSVAGLTPDRYSTVTNFATGGTYYRDPNNDGFNDIGSSQGWSHSNSAVWNLKVNFESQVHELHSLRGGMEYYYEEIGTTSISYPLYPIAPDPSNDFSRGDYPDHPGLARWVAFNTPSRGALFLQDNIEFSSINVKVGLRYDYLYLGKQVANPSFVKRYETITDDNNTDTPYEYADWVDYTADHTSFKGRSFLKQFTSGNFSPRLAIGYPISSRTVFYFNYGHFLQYPDRDQFFHDPVSTTLSNNYVGNPSLKPQRTIQYEAGFDQLVFEDLSLGFRGFYKDIFDYAAFRRLRTHLTLDQYVNLDYASTRGFEIIVTKGLSDHYSGSIGYTFQLAKGRSSNPFSVQALPALFGLPRETRLDYDQQHTINFFAAYRIGPNEDYDLFGMNFNNWGASLTWNFGSGFPYTPYNPLAVRGSTQDLYLKNTGNGPYTSEINVSLFKGISIYDKLDITITLDITNLLNRRNVDLNAGGFSSLNGRPVEFGDYDPETGKIYQWGATKGEGSFASSVSPFIFRNPRQVSLGLKVNWN